MNQALKGGVLKLLIHLRKTKQHTYKWTLSIRLYDRRFFQSSTGVKLGSCRAKENIALFLSLYREQKTPFVPCVLRGGI